MKAILTIFSFLLISVSYALASGGTEVEGLGFMAAFFIAFGVLIVLYQLIPGTLLLAGILKKIFFPSDKKATDPGR